MSAVSIETHIEGRQGHLSRETGREKVGELHLGNRRWGMQRSAFPPCRPVMVRIKGKKPEVLYLLESATI